MANESGTDWGQQLGQWDVDISTPELAAAVEVMEANREARTAYQKAASQVKEAVSGAAATIKDIVGEEAYAAGGARVRIGNFTVKVGPRSGGDISIDPWSREASLLGRPERLPE